MLNAPKRTTLHQRYLSIHAQNMCALARWFLHLQNSEFDLHVLVVTCYWSSIHCIPDQKFVCVSVELNHNRSPCFGHGQQCGRRQATSPSRDITVTMVRALDQNHPGRIDGARPAGHTHDKAAQRSTNDQLVRSHFRHSLVSPRCGAIRTIRVC